MTQIKEIKIIRLNTGEDVIASCIIDEETDSVLLDNPMKVMVSRRAETKQTLMLLMPWLPLELIEEDSIYVSLENVITFMTPKTTMIEYYMNMMEVYEKLLNSDEEMDSENSFDIEEEGDYLDEEVNKIQEYLEASKEKKTRLH